MIPEEYHDNFDVPISSIRAREILEELATYHGLSGWAKPDMNKLVCSTEGNTINAFYKYFTRLQCPSVPILLCIIEGLNSNAHHKSC